MVSKKGGLVTTALGILTFISSFIFVNSCTRPLENNPYSCGYVVCHHGGRCDSARCICPLGYEGVDCSNITVEKFYGTWDVTATNIGSDTLSKVGKDTTYQIQIQNTATLTTFFIYNFNNNPNYSNVLCTLDSLHSNDFGIDTSSAQNMYYDHYRIKGGYGFIHHTDSISATIFVRSLNSTVNWERDTFQLKMHRH